MRPPIRFGEPDPAGCACPAPTDKLRAALEGIDLAPCRIHEPARFAALEADAALAEAEFIRRAIAPEPPPARPGDPLAAALGRKVMPLNAPTADFAAAMGLGDAGTADPRTPIDSPDK